eukprot:scaffold232027_cov81-Attheya_sp.AAC.1
MWSLDLPLWNQSALEFFGLTAVSIGVAVIVAVALVVVVVVGVLLVPNPEDNVDDLETVPNPEKEEEAPPNMCDAGIVYRSLVRTDECAEPT